MRDSEIVASIVAGEPDGLAAAYDRYADPLYKYCRSVLSDPAGAAGAVQDTFVIAASRLGELGNPTRLRAWLYAVARNECLRIWESRTAAPAFPDMPDTPDGAADDADTVIDITGGAAERTQLRALLATAARGLDQGEREVLELHLRQELEATEVASVLGVSRSHAYLLAGRARDQLEACLVVLLVSRAGRGDCDELDGMLDGWDGQLTPALCRRVYRHIERCSTCTTRRVYELRPEVLLGLSPGAAMAAAAAESFRLAAGVPDQLRAHTLELAAGQDPGGAAHRAAAAGRAGKFGRDGFPEPLQAGAAKAGLRSSRFAKAAVAAAVVVAVGVTAGAFALTGGTSRMAQAGGKTRAAVPVTASSTGPSSASAEPSPGATSRKPPKHTRSPATTPPASKTPAPAPGTTSPPARPAVSVSVLGPGGAALPPGSQLTIGPSGTRISLIARGGTVTWSVTVSGRHVFVVGPSSGTLSDGETASVLIDASKRPSGGTVTVSPGGATYSLMVSRSGG
jgi:RNA polymerase sigma factor (sigma-70 family)